MSLRILTANLYSGRADPDSFAAVLRETTPDVVAIQELGSNSAEVLAEWGASRLLDPNEATTGMGMAVRVPSDLVRLDFPHRNPIRARFDGREWGFGPVEVVSAHLVNPISRPINQSRLLRQQELSALEQLLAVRVESRILVGDLNSSPTWPLYRRLAALATDAAVEAGTARRTWSYFPSTPPALRIDHAFVQNMRCVGTRLVKIAGCDHRGLLVELEPRR